MDPPPWTIGRLLTWTTDYLKQHGSESPRLDAEVLLAHARGCERIELYTCFAEQAADDVRDRFRQLVHQRANGTPVAHLVGHREFYSRDFRVTPDVLIPRPETEFVVVALLDHVKQRGRRDQPLLIADVGTGSGILAICAALQLPTATIVALDISESALAIAVENAERHGVADRIECRTSDLFLSLASDRRFDYIVSNPPYIAESERGQLSRDVVQYEPHDALFAGPDGLDVLRKLMTEATSRLRPGGCLITEFSPSQREALTAIAHDHGLIHLRTVEDLSQQPRVMVFELA